MAIPIISSLPYAYAQVGRHFQYKVKARNQPDSFGVFGTLPDGLTIEPTTGLISGFPTTAADPINVTVTASNSDGTGQKVIVFHIYEAGLPFFLGPLGILANQNEPMSAQLLWDGTGITEYAMSPVPDGMALDTATGLFDGTPTTPTQQIPLFVQATNGSGTAENFLGWLVEGVGTAPLITSPLTTSGTVGIDFIYQITAANFPDTFGMNPLFPWTQLKPSGKIFIRPTIQGDFETVISASNSSGTDSKILTIHIAPASGGGGDGEPPPIPPSGEDITEPPPELIAGGINFGEAKATLRLVVDNGVGAADPRVLRRTNEATEELLYATDPRTNGRLCPVGTMVRANVTTTQDAYAGEPFLLLPPQLENVYEVVVRPSLSKNRAFSDPDISQGWYQISDPFTWINPTAAHDNPTIDWGLVPDPDDSTVLRRKLLYPGIEAGTIVSVVGKKRYRPIVNDTDFLIIQNLAAMKLMIQAIEFRENRDMQNSMVYRQLAIQLLSDECFNHIMDPARMQRRRGNFEKDLDRYPMYSKGWIRARIALDNPVAQLLGKSEIDRLLDRAEMEALRMGIYKGSIEEFDAEVAMGDLFLPSRVESVLAISLDGAPMKVRSIFFNYLENGPGNCDSTCGGNIRDLGEEKLGDTLRRKFRIQNGSITTGAQMKAVCKLRWVKKKPEDLMTIRNLEALDLLCEYQVYRRGGETEKAQVAYADAKMKLENELEQYLSGVQHTLPLATGAAGLGYAGAIDL